MKNMQQISSEDVFNNSGAVIFAGRNAAYRQGKIDELIRMRYAIKTSKSHADIQLIDVPQAGFGIEDVRQLQRFLQLSTYQLPHKIAVIFEAQALNTSAQNALLKIIEEPPTHARIILSVPFGGGVLPTIVSRCQLVFLGEPNNIDLIDTVPLARYELFHSLLTSDSLKRLTWSADEAQKKVLLESFFRDMLILCRSLLLMEYDPTLAQRFARLEQGQNIVGMGFTKLRLKQLILHVLRLMTANKMHVSDRVLLDSFVRHL